MESQVALASRGFRVGLIDGIDGPRTRAALMAFQQATAAPFSPVSHLAGRPAGSNGVPALTSHVVTTEDLAALGPVPATWLGKSKALRLSHETLLEAMAERSASHPKLILRLNPRIIWNQVPPGTKVILPRFQDPPIRPAARVSINLKTCTLLARDSSGRVLLMAPCSIGRMASSRPVGTLRVVAIVQNPTYTFDPARFPESSEARSLDRKLLLPPGPNNPVGVAWIGLDRPGIGIHGTPSPETVGRPESHGCFRLANWDAAYLARISWAGLPVDVGDRD
jgi:lipoprotein-anchoring transpeptidase ErfK/SrfK